LEEYTGIISPNMVSARVSSSSSQLLP
jgi:hypothetical protein